MALTAQFTKRLGRFRLEVDITAESGGPLALLGASGSGKSVTLRCIAGILRPDSGRIVLDGRTLFDSEAGIDLPPRQRRVGYLFQQYALFPHMTVEQNIAAGAHALKGGARARRVRELTVRFRLEGLERRRPGQLSGGEQQRVALARMMAADPAVILLDEPFSALDRCLRQELEWEMQELLSAFPGPVVWVSHDRGEVYRSCRQVCVLTDGRSSPVTGMKRLMEAPVTVSAARLSECQNLVPVRRGDRPGEIVVPAWGLTLRAAAPWREGVTVLGIRAGHIRPAEAGAENAFPCEVLRVTEDVDDLIVALRPLGAAGAPPLRMELSKEAWAALPDRGRLTVAAAPERLLLLE